MITLYSSSAASRADDSQQILVTAPAIPSSYLDYSGRDDILSGGVKMIPVVTTKGTFHPYERTR